MDEPDIDVILESLAHLICADEHQKMRAMGVDPLSKIDPAWFDGFEPLTSKNDDDVILAQAHMLDLPIWPMDVCIASPNDIHEWQDGSWQFARVRTLDRKRWRGALRLQLPRMVELGVAVTEPAGWRHSAMMALGLTRGGAVDCRYRTAGGLRIDRPGDYRWSLGPEAFGNDFQARGKDEDVEWIILAGGLALRRRYYWSVLLGEGHGPRARFVTDLPGVREAFRLRDLPAGKARRAALRHWVKHHWRKSRSPEKSDKAWVREHLRGSMSFVWNGLRCELVPSEADAEKAQLLREARPNV